MGDTKTVYTIIETSEYYVRYSFRYDESLCGFGMSKSARAGSSDSSNRIHLVVCNSTIDCITNRLPTMKEESRPGVLKTEDVDKSSRRYRE
jgi:hypothetical protein